MLILLYDAAKIKTGDARIISNFHKKHQEEKI